MTNDKPSDRPAPAAATGAEKAAGFSSPACLAHEMDPGYAGYMSDAELVELLNLLLEGERAGAKALAAFLGASPNAEARTLLEAVKRDEARFAAMLQRQVASLGGVPSKRTGAFYEKALARDGLLERLSFLNRGQASVVRTLQAALPRVKDDRIHAALRGMLGTHETNIARCEALIRTLSRA